MDLTVWIPTEEGLPSSCHIQMPNLSATKMNIEPLLWYYSSWSPPDHLVQKCSMAVWSTGHNTYYAIWNQEL